MKIGNVGRIKRTPISYKITKPQIDYALQLLKQNEQITMTFSWTIFEKGAMDKERFVEFMERYIFGKYKDHLILMDNAGGHRNNYVWDVIEKSGNKYILTFILLVPIQWKCGLTNSNIISNSIRKCYGTMNSINQWQMRLRKSNPIIIKIISVMLSKKNISKCHRNIPPVDENLNNIK